MQQWKPEQVRKIWQRVQNENHRAVPVTPALSELYWEEWQDSQLLFRLSGHFKNGHLLRKMAQDDRIHANLLKKNHLEADIRIHQNNTHRQMPKIHPKLLLQQCYERKRKRLAAYQSHQSDPLFQKLAQQEQQHCGILLNILNNR